ncbi:MAG: hypothetical protein WB495_24855 [Xanthobacteraceae bacterium]
MRHDDGLHPGLGRHLTDVFRRDVLFVHVAKKSGLLFGCFCLPVPIMLKHIDDLVWRGYLSDVEIGAFRQIDNRVGRARVAGKENHTARGIKAI